MNVIFVMIYAVDIVYGTDWVMNIDEACADANNILKVNAVTSSSSTILDVCKHACANVYGDSCSYIEHKNDDTLCEVS